MKTAPCVLSVAYPYAPVGPAAVGGAEVILSQLEAALPQLGFESRVVAHAASQPSGKLYPVAVPPGEITEELRAATEEAVQKALNRAFAENPIALVHMHGMDFDRYTLPPSVPVLVTLHLPLAWCSKTLWDLPPNYHFVCVSESQRSTCPAAAQHRITVIENGVLLPAASALRPHGRYALMLARICEEKNLATGLDAARLAEMPAVLAGEVFPYPAHLRYFAEQIEPRLTRQGTTHTQREDSAGNHTPETRPNTRPNTLPEARFMGPVTGPAKSRLLARAACLLLPSVAPETSSLVAMEALAAGVPVIAMASGAVPDIVADGLTGCLITPGSGPAAAERMAAAIRRLPEINRNTCREQAVERFSLDRMIGQYAELWRQLARPPRKPASSETDIVRADNEPNKRMALGIYVEPLTSNAALEALLPEWTTLWNADPHASPFQHPAWLLPWWHQFGPEGQLHALALREQVSHRLKSFLPLYTYTPPGRPDTPRQLLLLGAGTSDYLDGLWSPNAPSAPSLALGYAVHTLQAWDTAQLSQIAATSPFLEAAKTAGASIQPAEPASEIDLAQNLPAKLRANAARYRRRAEKIGRLHLHIANSAPEALQNFDLLLGFHQSRWSGDETTVLSDSPVQAHHREALPKLLHAGLLRFFRLSLNTETIGVLYALADPETRAQRRLSLYLIGFNPDLASISPGTLLLHAVWTYAREEGFAIVDMLRGGEAYKKLWGALTEPTYAITLLRGHSSSE